MANYLQLGQALAKHLPMTEGCTSTVKLSKKGIEALSKKNPELGKVISEFTEGATNPTLEIAQKAQGNYAIAGFKIRSGETVLGKGAYSTSTGAKGAVEKMHVEKGDIITTISKEGNAEAVVSDVSKTDLVKAAQEKAKASEYMTKEVPGLNGDRVLVRKFKNGNTIEVTTRKDGSVRTKVTRPDGKWYAREKSYTTTELSGDEAKILNEMGYRNYLDFKRVDKNVRLSNAANWGGVEMPKSGRIYGTDLYSLDDIKLLDFKGFNTSLPGQKPSLGGYKVRELDGRTPKEVILDLRANDKYGYPTTAIIGKEKLNDWNALANVYPRNLRSLLP